MTGAHVGSGSRRYLSWQSVRHISFRGPVAGLCLTMVLAVPAGAVSPQSLGDLARQEAERRKSIKTEAKTFTNKDVPRAPAAPVAVPAAPADPAAAGKPPAQADAAGPKPATAGADNEPQKDEAYWSGRRRALLEQLDRNQTYADALQSRINALTTDFVNRDDPAQRAVIANDRQKAITELDRLKQTILDDRKAIAEFGEEARRAGVPPGWLR
jgi:hypothetical protein